MVDFTMVLTGQAIAYSAYCLVMILSCLSGTLILIGFLSFFYNIVMSFGLKGLMGIFTPSKLITEDMTPRELG